MNERSACRTVLRRSSICGVEFAAVLALVFATACGGPAETAPGGDSKAQTPAADSSPYKSSASGTKPVEKPMDSPSESGKPDVPAGEHDEPSHEKPADVGAGADAAGEAAESQGDSAGAEPSEKDTASPGDEPAQDPPADPKALLKEVRSKRTKDDRAEAALAEAEAAGAKLRDVAKAAKLRGDALFATPERAAKFYQWAADKDPKYPDPVFALAKQAAVKGEVDDVKKHLAEVRKRKGKKLLQQIEFDPMWQIVKDDPDVRALLQ